MIVATSGHVDHGKTSLVRALTGQDTDRTEEERRRGLSIELGFAWLPAGADGAGFGVDIVDVPGHERFMRTLMAGVGAVDAIMLVVAADEGAMPQTLEHIELIRLSGIDTVIVVLTKISRATEAERNAIAEDMRNRLTSAGMRNIDIVEVDSLAGLGIDHLRRMLVDLAAQCRPRTANLLPRFWIDRHFHRPGSAHVVTGTLHQGLVVPGQLLKLTPAGTTVRVRSLQRHGRTVDRLESGQRGALGLNGELQDNDCERGSQLLAESAWLQTQRFDARMELLTEHSPRGDLQIHLAGGAVSARQVPLRGSETSRDQGYVQWILGDPLACRSGDRFIVRNATTHRLIGSGVVIDPLPPSRGRQTSKRLAMLEAMDDDNISAALSAMLDTSDDGVDLASLRRSRHISEAAMEALLAPLEAEGELFRRDHWACRQHQLRNCVARLVDVVGRYHADRPQLRGPTFAALARTMGISLPSRLLAHGVREALDQRLVVQTGPCLHSPTHQPRPSAASEELFIRLRRPFQACAPRPPVIGELLQELDIERDVLQAALDELSALGLLVFVGRNRYLLPETAEQLYQAAAVLATQCGEGGFSAAEFRDLTEIGRNHSIAVLEYFDRSGLTRLRLGRRWLAGPAAP